MLSRTLWASFGVALLMSAGAVRLNAAVHLAHGGSTSDYSTIQAAVDAASDGDTVTVDAGTYIEQVRITKAITLQGAGIDQTIVRSPMAASLVMSLWKDLKNRDLYPIIDVKTDSTSLVTIKNLTVDGYDQGWLTVPYPDPQTYCFSGIAAHNSTLTVDRVKVTRVRELSVAPNAPPDGYTPADQPGGYNHHDSILVESLAGAGTHNFVLSNSTVSKFQKTGIQVWGPTLVIDIHDNLVQGYGRTLYSTGNGIQVASSDRSGQGGWNGDRRGTAGSIHGNQFLNFGLDIPKPGQPGSYLNLGLGGPAAILTYYAAPGLEIVGNTVTGNGTVAWHNSTTSNDGGFANVGILVWMSDNASVRDNSVSGFDLGIMEEASNSASSITLSGNTVSNNTVDIITASGSDSISLTSGPQVVAFRQTDNGIDTISNFGLGHKLWVFGAVNQGGVDSVNGLLNHAPVVDFTNGAVTYGDGSNVAAHSVQVSVAGGVTTLFINTDGVSGAQLQVRLNGVYDPASFVLNGGYISYKGVAFRTVPAGLTFTVTPNGGSTVTYTSPQVLPLSTGSTYTIGLSSPQTFEGETGTRYDFASWSDGGGQSHSIVVPGSGMASYAANLKTMYQLTTAVTPTGKGSVTPASGIWLPSGTPSNLSVLANAGYAFGSWTLTGNAVVADTTANPSTIYLYGPATATANMTALASQPLQASLQSKSGTSPRVWNIVLTNTGASSLYATQITALTVSSTSTGACTPVVTTSLPQPAPGITLAASASSSAIPVSINFGACPALARYNVRVDYSYRPGVESSALSGYALIGNQTK